MKDEIRLMMIKELIDNLDKRKPDGEVYINEKGVVVDRHGNYLGTVPKDLIEGAIEAAGIKDTN